MASPGYPPPVPRVANLPDRGRLIVATDLQGNLPDWEAVERTFERCHAERGPAVLVVTGDLVHGPDLSEDEWPDYLGSYYRDASTELLARARSLQARHPGRVHYLLGNHEHAHVGGPIVAKFFPDEAERLEVLLGREGARGMREWLREWPFVAAARSAGLVMLHAAPHVPISSVEDLEELPIEGVFDGDDVDPLVRERVAALFWSRTTSTERATSFLRAIDPGAKVAIYGHDVARAGYAIDREPLLCISTSFGCYDGDKLLLEWDLSRRAESATQVAQLGLRPLHPDAPPVHRA
jgi:hypothetical protein